MPEMIRSVSITVEIDTNKRTASRTFTSFEEFNEWYRPGRAFEEYGDWEYLERLERL